MNEQLRSYREFAPAPELAHLIECFWTSRAPSGNGGAMTHRVLPDGCTDIIFDFGPAPSAGDSPGHGLRSYVVGTMQRALIVRSHGLVDLVGVRFRPGGATPFVPARASELTDRHVALQEFWGADAADAESMLFETAASADTPAAPRVTALQKLLLGRLTRAPAPDPRVMETARRIEETGGRATVAILSESVGLGRRQLERLYAHAVGVSPKTACRIARLRLLLRRVDVANRPATRAGDRGDDLDRRRDLDRGDDLDRDAATRSPGLSWSRLAHACGYADQPHLVREFRALTGVTPSVYLAERG